MSKDINPNGSEHEPDNQNENLDNAISQGVNKPGFSNLEAQLNPEKVSKVYDKRYKGGESSVYATRFDKERQLPEGEWYFLKNAVEKSLNNFKERTENFKQEIAERESNPSEKTAPQVPSYNFTIFDFGCGDGRDLEFYRWFANQIPDVNIVVKAYDISPTGIESYKEKLKRLEFDDLGISNPPADEKHMCNHGILQKGNLLVELLSPVNPDIKPQDLANSIGKVDITSSLYGPTSHIFPSEARDNFLKKLVVITRDDVVLTVPGKAKFLKEQATYSDKRLRQILKLKESEVFYSPLDLEAQEQIVVSDLEAQEEADNHMLPYAVYSPKLLGEWLERADIEKSDAKISVCSYKTNPDLASRSKFWGVVDSWGAYLATGLKNNLPKTFNSLPEALTRVEYYGMVVKGKANEIEIIIDRSESPNPNVEKRSGAESGILKLVSKDTGCIVS
jgi:SAM-dependent methyltransferase